MLQSIKKYIFLHTIITILFFSNSGYLHAFMDSHHEDAGVQIIEHTHDDGETELHIQDSFGNPVESHCENTTVEGVIQKNSNRISYIDEGSILVSYKPEFDVSLIRLDEYQYQLYYPGPALESFSHLLIGETILVI